MNNNAINFAFEYFKNIQKKIEHLSFHIFLTSPFLIIYFFVIRQIFGLHFISVILLIVMLFLARNSIEVIAFIFFFFTILIYIFGSQVESNYYMSFVYGFILLSVLKYACVIFAKRLFKN